MSDYEAFVHELIGYIFKVQDKDDDNLSAEIICRKLYKYGLIENVNHEWRMKYRPKHRWPATVHNGRADKEDWQSYTIDRKTEPTMNASKEGVTNLEWIRTLSAKELSDLLYDYWLPRGQYVWTDSRKGLVKMLGENYLERDCDKCLQGRSAPTHCATL